MVNQLKEFVKNSGISTKELDALAKECLNQGGYILFKDRLHGRSLEYISEKFYVSREMINKREVKIIKALEQRKKNKDFETGLLSEYGSFIRQILSLKSNAKIKEDQEYEDMVKTLQTRIDGLERSARVDNYLKNENIETIGDLAQKTKKELLQYPNLGRESLKEITGLLGAHGLNLGMDIDAYKQSARSYVVSKRALDGVHRSADNLFNTLLNAKLEYLELPSKIKTRIISATKYANIETIGDLVQKTEEDMLQYPKFGEWSVATLKSLLKSYGLSFGMKVEKINDKYVLKE